MSWILKTGGTYHSFKLEETGLWGEYDISTPVKWEYVEKQKEATRFTKREYALELCAKVGNLTRVVRLND